MKNVPWNQIFLEKSKKEGGSPMNLGLGKKMGFSFFFAILIAILPGGIFAKTNPKPRILVVMSASDTILLDGKRKHPTGVFLNELYLPIKGLSEVGYDLVFATPNGKIATIDPESLKDKYWESAEEKEAALRYLSSLPSYLKPISLESAIQMSHQYIGLLVPGGQGLMTDLLYDVNVPKLIFTFQEKEKPIGLVCHAPALLTTLAKSSNEKEFILKGYKVNSVTKIEEWFIETFVMKGSPKIRNISGLLKNIGMEYKSSILPGQSYAIRDRNLVTSQNPFSGIEFTELYLAVIEDYLQKTSF
ncbi:DJ-1/PfpI family protein [Leptospira sp. 96542]|nr:DJ-1/PfpI family protein [Leptospira sp. 96542]